MQFNLRDLLWLTALSASLVCLYLERTGRQETSKRYVNTFERSKRLEADLAEARAAYVKTNRELERMSWERYQELEKEIAELKKEYKEHVE